MKYEDPWERYYRRSTNKRRKHIVFIVQLIAAVCLFAAVWGLGASGTEWGKASGRLVWQAVTMNGDFASVWSDALDWWEKAGRHPLTDSVKAVIARPISPLDRLVCPVEGKVVVPFGTAPDGTYHEGVEWEVAVHTPVKAVAAGKVLDVVRYDEKGSRTVIVQSGAMTVRYGYLAESWIAVGDPVARGQTIGRSGMKDGEYPRLSLVIREKGTAIDPLARMRTNDERTRAE